MTDLAELTKPQLLEIARERDLEGRSKMDRDELLAALQAEPEGDEQARIDAARELATQENALAQDGAA